MTPTDNNSKKNDNANQVEENEFKSTSKVSSGFIDYRPTQGLTTSMASGFGFTNVTKSEKKTAKKKHYSWRARVEAEEAKRRNIEDEMDFDDSSSDNDKNSGEDSDESGSDSPTEDEEEFDADDSQEEEEEGEEEEFTGFDDIQDKEVKDDVKNESESSENEDEETFDSEDEEDDSEDEEDDTEDEEELHTSRANDFKVWAEEQVRKMEGVEKFVPPTAPQMDYKGITREEDLDDGLEKEYIPINEKLHRKVFTVDVDRSNEIQQARMQLPVFAEEHRIMEAIHHNDCIIICGETGSGKTTQVPQFLFESGYGSPNSETPGMIGVTQPRRVAAVSMAERVGNELGNHGHKVGYQIRFDANVKSDTALKFMTDGVLLREMMNDFLLSKYSALIIDEAHERNINTDVLIGMLSRVLKLRRDYASKDGSNVKPLKLIIMSATLRVSDFSENKVLFDTPPPILKVDARQYPVSLHFNKRTAFNYTEEAFRKTCKIHRRLPKGGILMFLTGKAEITDMVKRLRKEFPFPKKTIPNGKGRDNNQTPIYNEDDTPEMRVSAKHADVEAEDIDFEVNEMKDDFDDEVGESENDEGEEEEGFEETLEEDQTENDPLYVLPLYSLLPTKEQMKVFAEPPAGSRLCVVATNIAETSLTIPGIRYVVDCGRSKERRFNEETRVQSFEIDWISKASADQRSGRAGRTGPGHCYRLFSSAVYENNFPQFSKPEILRMPVESVVLNMKSMGIDGIANFPFPTPPDRFALRKAEKLLQYLGALNKESRITDLGKKMSLFPLSPRFAKMLIIGNQLECLPYVIALVSGLSVGDPFLSEFELGFVQPKKESKDNFDEEEKDEEPESQQDLESRRKSLSSFNKSRKLFTRLDKHSDAMKLLSVICAIDHVPKSNRESFCKGNFLRGKILEETVKLRKQLTYIVKVNTSKESVAVSINVSESELKLPKPSKKQVTALKQMITTGFIDQIAVRADVIDPELRISNRTTIINVPYMTLFPSRTINTNGTQLDKYVYIHPASVLTNCGELPPEYIVYQSLNLGSNQQQTQTQQQKLMKLRMKPLNDISGTALANVAKGSGLVTYSKPLGPPYGPKNLNAVGTERECYVVPRIGAAIGTGAVGWDLPALRVKQKKIAGSWEITQIL
ncbi:unnamed protein product [Ambrosiozyma monospora]|uniref:Unnamed protein product n=1 Tax=Ambrosiozyma monospora TaxID=43982 RepID=A0ACB5STL2_AMBMO|nr:unnamed protein product [Ambrosiozyma monospora]